MSNLPDNWIECKLGDVIYLKNGYAFKSTDYSNEGIPVIRISDIQDGRVITEKAVKIPQSKIKETFILEAGDLLIAMSGATTGKTGLYTSNAPCLQNQRVGNLKLYSKKYVDTGYRNYYISLLRKDIEIAAYGGAQPNISPSVIENFTFPLAPLNEQKQIVAKLEKLFAKVKTSQERLDKIPLILKRFRQSVLMQACSGELTKEWRKQNPQFSVNGKLEELEKARKRECKNADKPYKVAVKIDIGNKTKGIDELFEIPDSWEWVSLGQVTWSVSDGPHFSPNYVEPDMGIPFISARNVKYEGIDFSDAKYVSPEDHAEFTKRGKPLYEDVLLTKGGTTGVATVVTTNKEFSIWVHVALLKVIKEFISPYYLRNVLTTPFLYQQSQAQTHGVGNQDLGLTRMIYMALPLPPVEEQQIIVEKVKELFEIADRIESRYQKARTYTDRLTQSILAKAFRGELVSQDPDDEPASVLLEHIRQEKAKPATVNK